MEKVRTLSGYLKQLRQSCGYTQAFVAIQLGIARQTYSHYETGRIMPPIDALYRIAKLYGIPMENLHRHMMDATGREGSIRESCHEEFSDLEQKRVERQLLFYFQNLDERDRRDILSMMQVMIRNQYCGRKTDLQWVEQGQDGQEAAKKDAVKGT